MTSVPLQMSQLDQIAEIVARDLLEKWAIDDRFSEEQLEKATQDAVDDAVFVINNFMEHFNQLMLMQAEEKRIIT